MQERKALTRMYSGRLGIGGAAELAWSSKRNSIKLSNQGIQASAWVLAIRRLQSC